MLYMPPNNPEAMVHYESTIRRRVPMIRVKRFLTPDVERELEGVFRSRDMAIWGSQAGPQNQSRFDKMRPRDTILIVEGGGGPAQAEDRICMVGDVAAKIRSPALSQELWKPLAAGKPVPWELVYFIADCREISVPFDALKRLFGFSPDLKLRGFTAISDERLVEFYARHDDLYSILVQIERGRNVEPVPKDIAPSTTDVLAEEPRPIASDDAMIDADDAPGMSEHLEMQLALARLGERAGERVWVPPNDQRRLARNGFNAFEPKFSAGIDVPHSYCENIDIIWKQEYRIDAAFEVEHSTSIYSGLLRFADLTIVAPNSIYPLYIVAPQERESRVRDQLRRPAFLQLRLADKVRFLPYEAVRDMEKNSSAPGAKADLRAVERAARPLV